MGSPEWRLKIDELYKSLSGSEGKRWARPEAPILHSLPDEKAEPHVFFHNTNYRISRKYINVEKVKVGGELLTPLAPPSGSSSRLGVAGTDAGSPSADSEGAVPGVRPQHRPCTLPQVPRGACPAPAVQAHNVICVPSFRPLRRPLRGFMYADLQALPGDGQGEQQALALYSWFHRPVVSLMHALCPLPPPR